MKPTLACLIVLTLCQSGQGAGSTQYRIEVHERHFARKSAPYRRSFSGDILAFASMRTRVEVPKFHTMGGRRKLSRVDIRLELSASLVGIARNLGSKKTRLYCCAGNNCKPTARGPLYLRQSLVVPGVTTPIWTIAEFCSSQDASCVAELRPQASQRYDHPIRQLVTSSTASLNAFFSTNTATATVPIDLWGASQFAAIPSSIQDKIRVSFEVQISSARLLLEYHYTGTQSDWTDLGGNSSGRTSHPTLVGTGNSVAGSPVQLTLTGAQASILSVLTYGTRKAEIPAFGGILVPDLRSGFMLPFSTSTTGGLSLPGIWPSSVPAGQPLFFQFWCLDSNTPDGVTGSNSVQVISR